MKLNTGAKEIKQVNPGGPEKPISACSFSDFTLFATQTLHKVDIGTNLGTIGLTQIQLLILWHRCSLVDNAMKNTSAGFCNVLFDDVRDNNAISN